MIYNGHWHFWAQWMPEFAGHRLAMIREDGDRKSIVTTLTLEDTPRHGASPGANDQPIPVDQVEGFLQAAMDCGWELGLRPTGAKDMTNELAAVRYHLEDMRLLAKVREK